MRRSAKPAPPPMFHRGDLRSRHWTQRLMELFLSPSEGEKSYRGNRVPLWRQTTIEAIEATPEFRHAFRKAMRRRVAANVAVETKRRKVELWIDSLEIEILDVPWDEMIAMACRHYNDRAMERAERQHRWDDYDRFREATPSSDPGFLARISVNMLRHGTNEYEESLAQMCGRVGSDRGYVRLKARVLDAIGAKYPGLATECHRQKGQTP